jgi:hypothetical protein
VTLDLARPDETVALMQPKDEGAFERAVKRERQRSSNRLV